MNLLVLQLSCCWCHDGLNQVPPFIPGLLFTIWNSCHLSMFWHHFTKRQTNKPSVNYKWQYLHLNSNIQKSHPTYTFQRFSSISCFSRNNGYRKPPNIFIKSSHMCFKTCVAVKNDWGGGKGSMFVCATPSSVCPEAGPRPRRVSPLSHFSLYLTLISLPVSRSREPPFPMGSDHHPTKEQPTHTQSKVALCCDPALAVCGMKTDENSSAGF